MVPRLTYVCSSVIVKLLGFTFAMITLPIGLYFLTVKTIFKGERIHLVLPADADETRQFNICGSIGGDNGERGPARVRDRCHAGGSVGATRGGEEGQKS